MASREQQVEKYGQHTNVERNRFNKRKLEQFRRHEMRKRLRETVAAAKNAAKGKPAPEKFTSYITEAMYFGEEHKAAQRIRDAELARKALVKARTAQMVAEEMATKRLANHVES